MEEGKDAGRLKERLTGGREFDRSKLRVVSREDWRNVKLRFDNSFISSSARCSGKKVGRRQEASERAYSITAISDDAPIYSAPRGGAERKRTVQKKARWYSRNSVLDFSRAFAALFRGATSPGNRYRANRIRDNGAST